MSNCKSIFLVALLLILLILSGHSQVLAADELEAREAIANAENLVRNCYNASLEAEKSGANITQLVNALNEAGMFLSRASLAYDNGNFTSAVDFATQTQARLNGFVEWAQSIKEMGLEQTRRDFLISIVAPIAGSVAIIFGSFIVWFFLKRRYGSAPA
jgi:hypothetical protein